MRSGWGVGYRWGGYGWRRTFLFSRVEIIHITIGIIVFLLVELGLEGILWLLRVRAIPPYFLFMILGLVLAFLLHELAHKFTAIRYGFWSEFRLSTWGAALSLLSLALPIRIIAPGAVVIFAYGITRGEEGRIAVAGPLTNLILAALFFSASRALPMPEALLLRRLAIFNTDLAFFNLLPFPPLDGSRVIRWSIFIWLALFLIALFMEWTTW